MPEHLEVFEAWAATHENVVETDDGILLAIHQSNNVDGEDRVMVGATALAALVNSGL